MNSNTIIQGDSHKVLPRILHTHTNKVKCIYIDPPYNNGEQYNHYVDDTTHERWQQNIYRTLSHLRPLLRKDGSIWISIDDNEVHYLKIIADGVFGRKNFLTTIVWQQRTTRENRKCFSNNHEYLLVYAANPLEFHKSRNLLPPSSDQLARYKNPDSDPRGPWQSVSLNVQAGHAVESQFYTLVAPNGKKHTPPNGRCWAYSQERMKREIEEGHVWFGKDGNGVPRKKKFLSDAKMGLTPETIWYGTEVGTNDSAKKHLLSMFPGQKTFDTPKPEGLIAKILHIATSKDDLVLDCYLGSGTTAAVAHKMGRRYIGIESGPHAYTIAKKRLEGVVKGESGGISQAIDWKGGGDFKFMNQKYIKNASANDAESKAVTEQQTLLP